MFERAPSAGQKRWILREMPDQTATRVSDRWANSSRVNRWVDSLRALRIERIYSETRETALGNLGLLSPHWIIEWSGRSLELGNVDSRGLTAARLRMGDRVALLELEGNALKLLNEWKTLADLREHKLLALDPQEIDTIEVERANAKLKLERDGDEWQLPRGPQAQRLGTQQTLALRQWLERVNDLRIQNFLTDPVPTTANLPTTTLTLRSFGKVLAQIQWQDAPRSAFLKVYHQERSAAFQIEKSEFAPLIQEIQTLSSGKHP